MVPATLPEYLWNEAPGCAVSGVETPSGDSEMLIWSMMLFLTGHILKQGCIVLHYVMLRIFPKEH